MDENRCLGIIKDVILGHKGDTPVRIYLEKNKKVLKTDKNLWAKPDDEFIKLMEEFVGKENFKYEKKTK